MIFNVGDVVECIDPSHTARLKKHTARLKKGQMYTIRSCDGSYLYLRDVDGGFLHKRFRPIQVMADISEYDDIMLAQDIYGRIE
jgi:hypothetical protein